MNFIHQHLLQTFYIHLPGLHEFYPPALAPNILYSLTWSPWILSRDTPAMFPNLILDNFFVYHVRLGVVPFFGNGHLLRKKLGPKNFHLTHPCFELCRSRSPYFEPHMCANPSWTNVPRHTTQPQTPRFHLTHPCFELCRSRSPYYTPHVRQPILNQCPKTHHKTSDPKIFISHIPVLNFAGTDRHIIPHMCGNPSWTNVPRHTTKPQTLRFSSHRSLFWTLPEQISILYPTCVPTHPEPMSQDTPQNLRPQDFHLTHPCFELCRNRSPYYTPHVWQPILNQCPKTPHNLRP